MQEVRELRDEKLDFWIKNNLNVLFIGHYGSGKTTRILDAFKRNNLNFKYFSAATMDPWCDFIGVPKVMSDDKGAYLDYILPRDLRDDTIEAIYMDEFNRSHKKVRNAVMELLQFKSINGRPFKNLRMIWAAINPEEEGDYQVEVLDKAQKDRFQIQVPVAYKPSLTYFSEKFDVKQAKAAISWWNTLSAELQMEVSPRRLEYAIQMFNMPGGNIRDVLPHSTNPSKLNNLLKNGPIDEKMKEMLTNKDYDGAKKFFQVENNYSTASKQITKDIPSDVNEYDWKLFFLQAIPMEKLQVMLSSDEETYTFIINNADKSPAFQRLLSDVLTASTTDGKLLRRIKKEIDNNPALSIIFNNAGGVAEKPYYSNRTSATPWPNLIAKWIAQPMEVTPDRLRIYDEIIYNIPRILTLQEAVSTLEVINMLASRSQAATLKQFKHLVGVVNHCIEQINKASGLSWGEILTNYGQKFDKLMIKMKDASLDKGILHPAKKVS